MTTTLLQRAGDRDDPGGRAYAAYAAQLYAESYAAQMRGAMAAVGLAVAPIVPRPPWWRRLLGWFR